MSEQETNMQATEQETKKRGRPRKNPDLATSEVGAAPKEPKKRGRPRKEVATDGTTETKPTKKRKFKIKDGQDIPQEYIDKINELATVLQSQMESIGSPTKENARYALRRLVRGRAGVLKTRVKDGNALAAAFKANRGIEPAQPGEENDAEAAKILSGVVDTYTRLSDAVALGILTTNETKGLFLPDEYALATQYMSDLKCEQTFDSLIEPIVKKHPLWDSFFSKIKGVGPWAAAVMLSEFRIDVAKSSSAMHKYAGLDVVKTYYTLSPTGKKNYMPSYEADLYPNKESLPYDMLGRTNKHYHLELVKYDTGKKDEDGNPIMETKKSISFNKFLRSVLVGVMFKNLVMAKKILVNGVPLGSATRLKFATDNGYSPQVHGAKSVDITNFLISRGHTVEIVSSKYLKIYEDALLRLRNANKGLTPLHIQNQARRYPIKALITDLYMEWCKLEGITPMPTYAERMLGRVHHQSAEDERINRLASLKESEAIISDIANDPLLAEDGEVDDELNGED